jgi:antirestriction protein ArdC
MTREKAKQVLEDLHNKIGQITNSEQWKQHLEVVSKFHNYSPLNAMFMILQWEARRKENPDLPELTLPAAFSTWNSLGRRVRKGEKALSVLAPIVVTDRENLDKNGNPTKKCVGFTIKNRTFDISQTEGEPLPPNPAIESVKLLTGPGDPQTWVGLVAVADKLGCKVIITDDCLPACGDFTKATNTIRIAESLDPIHKVKTLIHELAHVVLHGADDSVTTSRPEAEVEAESAAYVAANLLGFDTSDYSVGYVAGWMAYAPDERGKMIARTTERIIKAARAIHAAVIEHSTALAS